MTILRSCLSSLPLILIACSNSPMEEASSSPEAATSTPGAVEASAPVEKEDPPIPADTEIVTLESGVKYSVLSKGEGTRKAMKGDKVSMHYTGWLPDGTVFDSSIDRGQPLSFPLTAVIKGWQEGVGKMSTGAVFLLEVPADLGYGARGAGKIPPNSTTIYWIELLAIE